MVAETTRYKLNPFFRIRFGQPHRCDLLLEGRSFSLPSAEHVVFLTRIKPSSSKDDLAFLASETLKIENKQSLNLINSMITNRLIVDQNEGLKEENQIRHWIKRGWLEALIFHLASKDVAYSDAFSDKANIIRRNEVASIIAEKKVPEIWSNHKGERINLTPPSKPEIDEKFDEVLLRRRSNQPWVNKSIAQESVSNILYWVNRESVELRTQVSKSLESAPEILLRSNFCALETYVVSLAVTGLESGLFHYDLKTHNLVKLKTGSFRNEVVKMCIGQEKIRKACCVFVITAVWERYFYRYRHPRAYRNLLVNVAELAQKYLVASSAEQVSMFLTPALDDLFADQFIGVNGFEEAPLYVVAIG